MKIIALNIRQTVFWWTKDVNDVHRLAWKFNLRKLQQDNPKFVIWVDEGDIIMYWRIIRVYTDPILVDRVKFDLEICSIEEILSIDQYIKDNDIKLGRFSTKKLY